ncbi:MAG: DUF4957 domain-containing protein [Prevotella sp.]|nr:DUF4957 domain-containing protein [Prevotella sp.]
MNKSKIVSSKKLYTLATLAVGGWLLSSCADTYSGNDAFDGGVRNAQLVSPAEGDITITPNTDGDKMTITWPVVFGAGGYEVFLYDLSNDEVLSSDTIDGCSHTYDREEDVNYKLTIRTLGNKKLNNSDAPSATEKLFNSFEASFATIPEGDLYEYFQKNPIPETSAGQNLNFDLTPGGHYTVSDVLDFGKFMVTLRSTNKTNNAIITYNEGGGLATCSGFKAKYITFECEASTQPVLALSAEPNPEILDADHNNHHQIVEPISFQNCQVNNVKRTFMYDNKVKYCVKNFSITNTVVKFTPDEKMSSSAYFQIYDGGGFINDFTATNCTFWCANSNKVQYFIRYNNSGRCDRAGYLTNSINFKSCTFYNIAKEGQMANHGGFDGRNTSNYDITNNIFVDCGSGQVPRRITGRISDAATNNFAYNTYWFNGAPETEGFTTNSYDKSGNALQSDPAFEDAANGNFKPTGSEQVARKTGDPRWWNN